MVYGSLTYDSPDEILFRNEQLIKNLLIRAEEFFLKENFNNRDEWHEAKATFAVMQMMEEIPDKDDPIFLRLVGCLATYQSLEYMVAQNLLIRTGNSYVPNEKILEF